ncbi:hypothetical protein D9M71_257300 [compost metagenome]
MLADLLHFANQQQILVTDLTQHLGRVRAGLLDQYLAALQLAALAAVEGSAAQHLQLQRNPQQALPDQQGALALDSVQWRQVVSHQGKGAVGQALAVLAGAHLVEQMQAEHAQHRHQHQGGEHAAIDAQEDRVHCTWPMASAASRTNR